MADSIEEHEHAINDLHIEVKSALCLNLRRAIRSRRDARKVSELNAKVADMESSLEDFEEKTNLLQRTELKRERRDDRIAYASIGQSCS